MSRKPVLLPLLLTAIVALGAGQLGAVPVTEPYTATVAGGDFDGTVGTGSFTYDDTSITGAGNEVLDPTDGLTLDLTLLGQTFFETDDIDFPGFPELSFLDGTPVEIDFVVAETGSNPVAIDEPGVSALGIGLDLTPAVGGGFETDAFVTVVPEPSAATLGVIGFLLTAVLCWRRR